MNDRREIEGEGGYSAARDYQKSVRDFVDRKKNEIDELAEEAEAALDGPDGDALRRAEAKAQARGRT